MKRILVVDDEPHLRLLYEIELAHAGYSILTAANARECLEYIRTTPIDLVILDLRMPGMDGVEVLQTIIAHHRGLPVIIHTAFNSYRENYLTWGAVAYVVKSPDLKELLATVDRVLHPRSSRPQTSRITEQPMLRPHERNEHATPTP